MSFHCGVDIGSLTCDVAILDGEGQLVAHEIMLTGARSKLAIDRALTAALNELGLEREALTTLVATGYGRDRVDGRTQAVTEITCHARGAHALFPETQLVLDVGGQDCKAVRLDSDGRVVDFHMNDKCASGTGRFFEVMARALEIDLDEFGPLALRSKKPVLLSSVCTVFAESEVVSLVAADEPPENIAMGLCQAAALRVFGLAQKAGLARPITMTGGGALNSGLVRSIERLLCVDINVPERPQLAGALGAALLGWEASGGRN